MFSTGTKTDKAEGRKTVSGAVLTGGNNSIGAGCIDADNGKDIILNDVTIIGKGKYTGTTKAKYKIVPKGTSLKKLKKGKKSVTVRWKKQSTKMSKSRITGYQIQLATDSKFEKSKRL